MTIYIASSWKNQHAVEMLTKMLRDRKHTVLSFVENNHGEYSKDIPFDEWCNGALGAQSFMYDTQAAMESDLTIYIGPSGTDAWAEVGCAYASGKRIFGLWAKGEQAGLMRNLVSYWCKDFSELLAQVYTLGIILQK